MEHSGQRWKMTAALSLKKLKTSALYFAILKCQDIKELNIESIVLRERSQLQETTHRGRFHLLGNVWNWQTCGDRRRPRGCLRLGDSSGARGVTASRSEVLSGGIETFPS